MEKIGLQALFEDANFQAGLARYLSGLAAAGQKTEQTASQVTGLGHTISTALGSAFGTAIGLVAFESIKRGFESLLEPLKSVFTSTQQWGGQLLDLFTLFGLDATAATQYAVALNRVGVSVEEGGSGLNFFIRSLENLRAGMEQAAATYRENVAAIVSAHQDALAAINENQQSAEADAADRISTIWSDLNDKRAEIESDLADRIGTIEADLADRIDNITTDLNDRLAQLAHEREKVERDLAESLETLGIQTALRLRTARSAAERRTIRLEAAERARELQQQAADRKAELDREAALAKANADKQIALAEKLANKQIAAAEKVAQKQIIAADKAADKQVAAVEKALAKQEVLFEKQRQKENENFNRQIAAQQATLAKAQTSSPLSKALEKLGIVAFDAQGKIRPLEELMPEIMDAFQKLPEGIDASAISMQLFGRAGTKFLHFLRLGSDGLKEARQLGIDLGLVLDPTQIEEYEQAWNLLHLGLEGAGVSIGRVLLPYAKELLGMLNTELRKDLPLFDAWLARMNAAFKSGGLTGLIDAFAKWTEEVDLGTTIAKLGERLLNVLGIVFGPLAGKLTEKFWGWLNPPSEAGKAGTGTISTLASNIGKALSALADDPGVQAALKSAGKGIGQGILNAIKDIFSANAEGKSGLTELNDSARQFIVSGESSLLAGLLEGIAEFFGDAGKTKPLRDAIVRFFGQMLNDLLTGGFSSFGTLGDRIRAGVLDAMGLGHLVDAATRKRIADQNKQLGLDAAGGVTSGFEAGMSGFGGTITKEVTGATGAAAPAAKVSGSGFGIVTATGISEGVVSQQDALQGFITVTSDNALNDSKRPVEPYANALGQSIVSDTSEGVVRSESSLRGYIINTSAGAINDSRRPVEPFGVSLGSSIMDAIGQGVTAAQRFLSTEITYALQVALNLVTGQGTTGWWAYAVQLGNWIIQGITSGIASAGNILFNALKNAVIGALDDVTNLLGAHSPSLLFEQRVGFPIGEGITEGVRQSLAGFKDTLSTQIVPRALVAPMSRSSITNSTVYNFSHTWPGNVSQMDMHRIEGMVREVTLETITSVAPRMR